MEQLHVNGNGRFDFFSGSLTITTPGGWPGIIAYETGGNRRDLIFRDYGIALLASTSSASPGYQDGIWILEGGNVGIHSSWTGSYPLFINQRSAPYGLALFNESSSETWEIFSGSSMGLYYNTTFVGSFSASTGVYSPISDKRFKRDIKPLDSSLGSVIKLRPSTYEMNTTNNRKREIGFVAQEVKDQFPELVHEVLDGKTGKSILTLNYTGITVVAVKAIQEQQEIIEQQAKRIEALEKKFERLQKKMRRF
jgi:hypothetical protein